MILYPFVELLLVDGITIDLAHHRVFPNNVVYHSCLRSMNNGKN
jgi:hypothetical protein